MCQKSLAKLILKINSNGSSKHLSFTSTPNFSPIISGSHNLKQFSCSINNHKIISKNSPSSLFKDCPVSLQHNISNEFLYASGTEGHRFFCSKRDDLPKLMDIPNVVWPSFFKTMRNWILSNFIIMRYFDNEFNLPDFVVGSKQAVELVSGMISRGDADNLTGLVTPEVTEHVKQSLGLFTLKQRQEFAIKADDVYFCFPYEVGVMFPNEDKTDSESQSRFVEITMCYHAMRGLKELRDSGVNVSVDLQVSPEFQDRIFICNYRFIREFTKGVQDDWTINAINHFKPAVVL